MIYIFGDCELDAARCELWRAGATVTVEPKVFKVLVHLIVHRDRLVTKDDLLERFWPGTFMAVAQSAYHEAVVWFEQALAALPHLPERRDTHEQAIEVQFELRHALVPLGEGERILTCLREAEALAATLAEAGALGPSLHPILGHGRRYSVRG